MKYLKPLVVLLAMMILLSACASEPSESAIQTAIVKTQSVFTPTPTITETPNPTQTPTTPPTSTSTPEPTPTSTPDVRIIDIDPQKFLIQQSDLPVEGRYYLPGPGWISPHLNEEVISTWGVEKGREYVLETGRVKGWWVYYARGTRAVRMPEEVFCNVVMYKTAEGAQLTVTDYNDASRDPQNWKQVDKKITIGDVNRVVERRKTTSGGDIQIYYLIKFSYRNFVVSVGGWGYEKDVSHEFVEGMAKTVLKKLMEAPLSMPPAPTPTP